MAALPAAFTKLPKAQQWAAAAGIIAVPLIVLGWLTWQALGTLGPVDSVPQMLRRTKPGSIGDRIASTQQEIEQQDAILRQKPALQKQLDDLAADIKEAKQRLPSEAEKTEMRERIERLLNDINETQGLGKVQFHGVKITESGGRGRDAKAAYQTVTYDVEISGELNGIIRYIDLIEKNTRFMTITSFSLTPGTLSVAATGDRVEQAPHKVKLTIVTYVYIEDAKGR